MLKWLGGIGIGALLGAGTVLLLRHELTDVEYATPAGSPTEESYPVEQHVPLRDPTVGETAPREIPRDPCRYPTPRESIRAAGRTS